METYYKVVRRMPDGCLVSALVLDRRWRVEYKPGQWVEPQLGAIFLFENKDEALRMADMLTADGLRCAARGAVCYPPVYEVWEAEAENPFNTSDLVGTPALPSSMLRYWLEGKGAIKVWPHSVLSRKVRLTRRLAYES
jgi:hypothetical protein